MTATLYFSDILQKAELDPANVKLIRHPLSDERINDLYKKGKIYEYTCHQRLNFSKGYDYWAVFLGNKGKLAKFYALYKAHGFVPDTPENMPEGLPEHEAQYFRGENSYYDLEYVDLLREFENRLVIEWGNSTRMWHQKGTTEKPIVAIQADPKKVFYGYEDVILSYEQLKDIVENPEGHDAWHTALSSVNAIYLIVDRETGKQYVGSAYGKDGLLGRWACYVDSHHGNNKLMKELICAHPDRYQHFQFSILQILPKTATEDEVIRIENRYKDKLLSKRFGLNAN